MKPSLTAVRGIGRSTADVLAEHGIHSVADLAAAKSEAIAAIPGFGPARAAEVIKAASTLLASGPPPSAGAEGIEASCTPSPKAPAREEPAADTQLSEPQHKSKAKEKSKKGKKAKDKKKRKGKERDKDKKKGESKKKRRKDRR